MRHLLPHLHQRIFRLDEALYRQDEPAVTLFFIVEGSVGLFVRDPEGRMERFQVLLAGDCCGLAAVHSDAVQMENAIAHETTEVLILMRSEWALLRQRHPLVALDLLSGLLGESQRGWHAAVDEYVALTGQLVKAHIIL